jgi:uncharacterized protein YfeS
MTVEETCIFESDPDNPDKCLFTQHGHVTAVKALMYLGRLVEDAAVSRMHANSHRGRDALLLVVDTIKREYDEIESQVAIGLDDICREIEHAAASLERITREKAKEHIETLDLMRNAYNQRTLHTFYTAAKYLYIA